MSHKEFYAEIDNLLELDPGTIKGDEQLADLKGWDSLAVLSFMAMADANLGVLVSASALAKCRTVPDLLNLLPGKIAD
jgi:acyl carrier protein